MNIKVMVSFLLLCFSLACSNAYAGITLNGTRLIFNGNKNEAVMTVDNPDNAVYLIQSWVRLDDEKSSEFIVTPPLFRIEPNSSNTLRIILLKNNLPKDKESLFWLNVKAIPSSDANANNVLLIAINTKIKLIYRPTSLLGKNAEAAYKKLQFNVDTKQKELIASNPTPYYMNLSKVTYNGKEIKGAGMIEPYSEVKWKIKSATINSTVTWSVINDFGGESPAVSQKIN